MRGLDRHHGPGPCAGLPAAAAAAAGARARGRAHLARLRTDGAAARAARDRGGDPRPARRPVAAREGALADLAARRPAPLGQGPGVRHRARARLARADPHRTPARDPELDHLRLRVRMAPAPARLPCRDSRGRPGRDPAGAARALRRQAAEAGPVPGPEGGVLPRGLRARSGALEPFEIDSARALVVVRTPPDVSLYHRRSNPLFPQSLDHLGRNEYVQAIVLPRTAEQRDFVRGLGCPRCRCRSARWTGRA